MQQNPSTLPLIPSDPVQCPVPLGFEDLAKVSGAGLPDASLPAGTW